MKYAIQSKETTVGVQIDDVESLIQAEHQFFIITFDTAWAQSPFG
jgi:hypothetical protein